MLIEPPTATAQIRYRGDWNAMYSYIAGDVVTYQGETFIAQIDVPISPNPSPGNSPWVLMAAKGQNGATGAAGSAGANGSDGSGVPAGGTANQVLIKNSATNYDTSWGQVTPANIGAASASHTHSISDVTNLSSSLSAKADATHTHSISDVSGLQTALDAKAASSHSHSASDIASGTIDSSRLPIATASVVGAVKPGTGLTVDGNGVLNSTVATNTVSVNSPLSGNGSAGSPVSVATATTSNLGVVQPDGSTITIVNGVISSNAGSALTQVSVNGTLTGNGTAGSPLGVVAGAHTHALTAMTGQATLAQLPVAASGVSSDTLLVRADDSRLSNARTPTSHSHTIGDLPVATSGTSNSTQLVRADDSRLSDARTPVSHTHSGSDITSGTIPSARITSADNLTSATVTQPTGIASAVSLYNSSGKEVELYVNSTGGLTIFNDVAANTPSTQFRVLVDNSERLACTQGGVVFTSSSGSQASLGASIFTVPNITIQGDATVSGSVAIGNEFVQGSLAVGDPTNMDGVIDVYGGLIAHGSVALDSGIPFLLHDETAVVGKYLRCQDSAGSADWQDLTYAIDTQTFTSSGTWTKPSGAVSVVVEMCGGGGGGSTIVGLSGGAGGSGGVYETLTFAAGELTSTVSVTCGAGGAASGNGGDSLFGAFTTDANSYLRAAGGPNGATARTSSGIPSTGAFGAAGLGATATATAGAAGKYGGRGPGGGGGGGRGAAGGAGGKGGVVSWTGTTVTLGGGAAGGANGSNGTNASSFHGRTGFGDGGGGGGGGGTTGGTGIRGGGGGGGGGGDGIGGAGGAGVVIVRTMCIR